MAATAAETACTYACLLLHDDELPISSENIVKVLNAANVKVDSYWPGLFAKLCEKKDVDELLLNTATSGAAVAAPAAAVAAADSAPAAEEKKREEVKEESEEETGLFDLFD